MLEVRLPKRVIVNSDSLETLSKTSVAPLRVTVAGSFSRIKVPPIPDNVHVSRP